MKKISHEIVMLVAVLAWCPVFFEAQPAFSRGDLDLPAQAAPEEYGDVLISRRTETSRTVPVIFSHWVHRTGYTCRVCHVELEFFCSGGSMGGKYCETCHDGTTAFGPSEQGKESCDRCHNATAKPNRKKFSALQRKLPSSEYGNEIDWVKALKKGAIDPQSSIDGSRQVIRIDKTLRLRAEMSGISESVFPHGIHEAWLDCSNCHPELFTIKKKSTQNFSMDRIVRGEFCGVCHLKIAFPLNDCRKCHPAMRR